MKLKKYKCRYCGESYEMSVQEYGARSITAAKRCCKKPECMSEAAIVFIENKKEKARKKAKKEWARRKAEIRENLGITKKNKSNRNPLQDTINKIVRHLDMYEPCYVFPLDKQSVEKQAGHVRSVSARPNLRYFLGNIFGESIRSNNDQNITDEYKLHCLGLNRGEKYPKLIDWVDKENRYLGMTKYEMRAYVVRAKNILDRLSSGEVMTRKQIDLELGIYVLPSDKFVKDY